MHPAATPGGALAPALVRAKLEYAPARGWEEVTPRERTRWWAALVLRPGATLVLARVGVADSALLDTEHRDVAAVLDARLEPGTGVDVPTSLARVEAAVVALATLPEGRFLLRREAGQNDVVVLSASEEPLPGALDAGPFRAAAGALDALNLADIPLRWQPAQAETPQLPFTYPPAGAPPASMPRRRARQAWASGTADKGRPAPAPPRAKRGRR